MDIAIKKAKNDYYVCSIYCTDLQDYPYFPFTAKSVSTAICKYFRFCMNKSKICPNPELHIIGTCKLSENGSIVKIQKSMYVYSIDTDNLKAKQLYYTVQLQEKVSECLNRFFLNLQDFSLFLEKNMKKYLIIKKEN